jgi:cysteine desulfurase/selenocysteine lyase
MEVVYLDNAATSFPKPEATLEAMMRYQRTIGGSSGRSGHRLSIEAGRVILDTREILARLFNVDDPLRIVFTGNATEALNIALIGLLKPGDHVITTGMEHNSVMRPLRFLTSRGIDLSVVPTSDRGELDLECYGNNHAGSGNRCYDQATRRCCTVRRCGPDGGGACH